jgi:hypothetical protein
MVGTLLLACLLVLHVWPFSRPAVLIPVAWWAMYLVNRRRVSAPVLGLIDAAAEKAGYYPVPAYPVVEKPVAAAVVPEPAPVATPAPVIDPLAQPDLDEDGELSIA